VRAWDACSEPETGDARMMRGRDTHLSERNARRVGGAGQLVQCGPNGGVDHVCVLGERFGAVLWFFFGRGGWGWGEEGPGLQWGSTERVLRRGTATLVKKTEKPRVAQGTHATTAATPHLLSGTRDENSCSDDASRLVGGAGLTRHAPWRGGRSANGGTCGCAWLVWVMSNQGFKAQD